MKKEVNIGLIGFGVVGSGTMQILREHKKEIEARVGASVKVRWVCSRKKKKSKFIPASIKQTKNWRDVVNDPKVDCVVELIGGTQPALSIVTTALKKKKHVVTANKAILSKYWNEIFSLALKNKRLVYFEAAVGGGVPVVQALNEGMAGNNITKIVGILNGTTNYILTQMKETGLSFSEALKEAQEAGFAEANPSFDINGVDAAQKISILGSLALGKWVPPSNTYCEGIAKLDSLDLRLIQERLNKSIKLLGIAEQTPKGWSSRVHPTLIPNSHPFVNVRNEYNAISLHGDRTSDVMIYGKGAGKFPTSSAVISDLIFLLRQVRNESAGQLPYVQYNGKGKAKLAPISEIHSHYYLRVNTKDSAGVLSRITGILGRNGVSISSVHQDNNEKFSGQKGIPIILVTHLSKESNVQASVKLINRLPSVVSKVVLIRMEAE